MAVTDRRKDSFLTYPVETTQTIESLSDAGYFYAAGITNNESYIIWYAHNKTHNNVLLLTDAIQTFQSNGNQISKPRS